MSHVKLDKPISNLANGEGSGCSLEWLQAMREMEDESEPDTPITTAIVSLSPLTSGIADTPPAATSGLAERTEATDLLQPATQLAV